MLKGKNIYLKLVNHETVLQMIVVSAQRRRCWVWTSYNYFGCREISFPNEKIFFYFALRRLVG